MKENLKIELIKINDIKEYENNAKEHTEKQINQIKNSIKEFGFNDPIAIDENNVIIEGHGRLIALKELGYTEIPIIRLTHLSKIQKKAYIIAHNKLTMNTDFDLEKLESEFRELEAMHFDFSLTGFDDFEVNHILEDEEDIDLDEFISDEEKEKKEKRCPHCNGLL